MERHNQNLLQKYNLNRRLADHRVPKDFNSGINKPSLTRAWFKSYSNKVLYEFFYMPGLFMCLGACASAFAYCSFDYMLNNHHTNDDDRGRLQATYSQMPNFKYINHVNNHDDHLGKWNHNFECFENEPNCGRDVGLTFIKKA